MNFLNIYNHYIAVEQVIEVEPERPLIIRVDGVDKVIEEPKNPKNQNPWLIDRPISMDKPSVYLHLNLLDGHIAYTGNQKSTVVTAEDGLLEGVYSVERDLILSREAFTAIVIKTFSLWRNVQTYYMVHGGSRKFNKFRDMVVIREDRLTPVTLRLNNNFHEYYARKFSLQKDPAGITIPLVSFSRPAFNFLTEDPILTIPEYLGEEEDAIQDMLDGTLSKFPKWYL
jgi:hypothetical protein